MLNQAPGGTAVKETWFLLRRSRYSGALNATSSPLLAFCKDVEGVVGDTSSENRFVRGLGQGGFLDAV